MFDVFRPNLAKWSIDEMVSKRNGHLAKWSFGDMVIRQNGQSAKWFSRNVTDLFDTVKIYSALIQMF